MTTQKDEKGRKMPDEVKKQAIVDCVSAIGAVRCIVPDMDFDEALETLIEDGNIQVIEKDKNRRACFFRTTMIAFVNVDPEPAIKLGPGLIDVSGRKLQ
jgi:hypothetical protein